MAEIALEEGKPLEAEKMLAQILVVEPNLPEADPLAARPLLVKGKTKMARQRLREYYDQNGHDLNEREQMRWIDWFWQVEDGEYANRAWARAHGVSDHWYPLYQRARTAWQSQGNIAACEELLDQLTDRGEDQHTAVVLLHGELALACEDLPCARLCMRLLTHMDTEPLEADDIARWQTFQRGCLQIYPMDPGFRFFNCRRFGNFRSIKNATDARRNRVRERTAYKHSCSRRKPHNSGCRALGV